MKNSSVTIVVLMAIILIYVFLRWNSYAPIEIREQDPNNYDFQTYSLKEVHDVCSSNQIEESLLCVKYFVKKIYLLNESDTRPYSYDSLLIYGGNFDDWILLEKDIYVEVGYAFEMNECFTSENSTRKYLYNTYFTNEGNKKLYILYGVEPWYIEYYTDSEISKYVGDDVACASLDEAKLNSGIEVIR